MKKHQSRLGDLFRVLAQQKPKKALAQLPQIAGQLDIELRQRRPATSTKAAAAKPAGSPRFTAPTSFVKPQDIFAIEQPTAQTEQRYLRIYSSYHAEDADLVEQITDLLMEISQQYQLLFWDDNKVIAGEGWLHRLNEEMGNADICLLFLSSRTLTTRMSNMATQDNHLVSALSALERQNHRLVPIALEDQIIPQLPGYLAGQLVQGPSSQTFPDPQVLMTLAQQILAVIEFHGNTLYAPADLGEVSPLSPAQPVSTLPLTPMHPPNLLRAFLAQHLAQDNPTGRLDSKTLVDRASRKRPWFPLPYHRRGSFSHPFVVIIDVSNGMHLFQPDIQQIVNGLSQLCPPENLRSYRCFGAPNLLIDHHGQSFEYPTVKTTVLLFSLLGYEAVGQHFDPDIAVHWQRFLAPLNRQGIKVCHMAPVPARCYNKLGLNWVSFMGWGHVPLQPMTPQITDRDGLADNETLQIKQLQWLGKDVYALAQMIAVTACCSLGLLRHLKDQFAPGASHYAELVLVHSKLLRHQSIEQLQFPPPLAKRLRQSLYESNPQRLQAIFDAIEDYRYEHNANQLLIIEEAWLNQPYLEDPNFERLEKQALSVLKSMTEQPDRREALASWLDRLHPQLSPAVQRVTAISRSNQLAGNILGRFHDPDAFIYAENRSATSRQVTPELMITQFGDRLGLKQFMRLSESVLWPESLVVNMLQYPKDSPRPVLPVKISQKPPNRPVVEHVINISDKQHHQIPGITGQFPTSIVDQAGNRLWVMGKPDVIFLCADKDWHYVEMMMDKFTRRDIRCITLSMDRLSNSEIELMQVTDPNPHSVAVALISQAFVTGDSYKPPLGALDNLHEIEFFLFTDTTSFQMEAYARNNHLQESIDTAGKRVTAYEQLDDMDTANVSRVLDTYCKTIESQLSILERKTQSEVVQELEDAINADIEMSGKVIAVEPDYQSETTNLIVDFKGTPITIRDSEQGLFALDSPSQMKGQTVSFVLITKTDKGYDGSIRLADLRSMEVSTWFDRHTPGNIVRAVMTERMVDGGVEMSLEEKIPALMFDCDASPGQEFIHGEKVVILQLDKSTGYVRVGQQQLLEDHTKGLMAYITTNPEPPVEVLNEHPEGIDLAFGEGYVGFMPNEELAWGIDAESGWQIQSQMVSWDELAVVVIEANPDSAFPLFSRRMLTAQSFDERVSHLQTSEKVEGEWLVDGEGCLLLLLEGDIVATLYAKTMPDDIRSNPYRLNALKRDGFSDLVIDEIDLHEQTITVSIAEKEG